MLKNKRIFVLALCSILLAASFLGCQKEKVNTEQVIATDTSAEGNFKIVTSFYPMYIAVLNIVDGAQGVEIENLASPDTGCLHDYQLKTGDMKKLEEADVFVANGAGMESFLDDVLENQKELDFITATDGIELIEGDEHEESDHESENHSHEDELNAHVWMSFSKYMQEVDNIASQLAALNPENAQVYRTNATAYNKKVMDLKKEMITELGDIESENIVILHDAFAYFAEEFGLNVVASVEVESEQGLSAKEIKSLIEVVKASNANMLFAEKQYSGNIGKTIEAETDITSYVWDSCVTGDMERDAYLNAMRENAKVLKEAFNIE